jgi:4-hydroxybutyrate dehydrogenase
MAQFLIKPQIHQMETFKEFCQAFRPGADDLVLTHEFLYQDFMKQQDLACRFVFQERYGQSEPSDQMIDQMIADIGRLDCKRVIAVGGGTVIDIAKVFALEQHGRTEELFAKTVPARKCRQLVIVPTTCGTGSEVTNLSIVEIKSRKTKLGLASPDLFADDAVLIPELIAGLPYKFFMYSSVDALIHAIESFLAPKSNTFTELFAVRAIERILSGYRLMQEQGPQARLGHLKDFLAASTFAGIAFANTGVGTVHALSYPLGANYHVPHGEANYAFLMAVLAAYARYKPGGRMKELGEILQGQFGNEYDPLLMLAGLLEGLIEHKKLAAYGMKPEEVELYTQSVLETQQRLLVNSYVPMDADKIRNIYSALYS